ncbi:MAG: ATP-dependent sacrificial sulfur transferase LarE [Magnetococcales bacterium]|nr:ATP-dependent sacrificial sulfur transferase LarE [Magnetococcales bacterium]
MTESDSDHTHRKYLALQEHLKTLGTVLVAFSGGVDSTFLVRAVQEAGIAHLAVTARSPTMPARDLADVLNLVQQWNVQHRLIDSDEINDPNFARNAPDRCFHCKSDLFGRLTELAKEEGYAHVLDGSTTDDLNDYRPGMQAKKRFGVSSPLLEAGLTKAEIRQLSQKKGLTTWNKPASPCLSSRIVYGEPIRVESLRMVEQAENGLRALGFTTLRVRKQGETARIELTEPEMSRLLETGLRQQVSQIVRACGFQFVTLDLEGFQSGKLNRSLPVISAG